jgi:hypothetical protein
MSYDITGTVTLICVGCTKPSAPLDLPGEIDGQPIMTWWIKTRGERCRECYTAQLSDPGAPGTKERHDASDTMAMAALQAMPRSGTQRRKVLAAIAEKPRTDDELQYDLAMSGNTERPRRVELVEGGWIEDSNVRRPTHDNQDAIVWALTHRGRTALGQEPTDG